MKPGFVKSSPRFFRLIAFSSGMMALVLAVVALFAPAPLQPAANPAVTPNPAKSAWFLLWLQELVSWSRLMVYPVLLMTGLMISLPWLVRTRVHRASWLPPEQRGLNLITVLCTILLVALTLVAALLRGADWRFFS